MLTYHYLSVVLLKCGKKTTVKERASLIIRNSYKFDSLMIADMFDELEQIDGKPTSQVYSVYKYIANNAKIKVMSNTDFSRFICSAFGYYTRVERNGKPVRVYRKTDKAACSWKNSELLDKWNELSSSKKLELVCQIKEENPPFSIQEFNTHIQRLLKS